MREGDEREGEGMGGVESEGMEGVDEREGDVSEGGGLRGKGR